MGKKNIIITVLTLRSIIATASSSISKFNKIRTGTKVDWSDPRMQLVVDVLMIIDKTFEKIADRSRIENFINYNMADNQTTFWNGLTGYYQGKLGADIRSFNRRMRQGGYWIER